MTTTPLVRSLSRQVAARLRNEILAGILRPGEPLREVRLANRFDVSRGPVREALVELTKEGLLQSQPRGGVRVAHPATDEIHELVMPIRRTIETYALRLFFDKIDARDFANWHAILESMRLACEQGDLGGIAQTDIALHRSFLERSGQEDLLAIWSTIVARMRTYFAVASRSYDDMTEIHREHVELIEAFRGGDIEVAVKALEDHIW